MLELLKASHVGKDKERESTELHGSIMLLLDSIVAGSTCMQFR